MLPEKVPDQPAPDRAEVGERWPIRIERAAELLHRGVRGLKDHLREIARQGRPCGRRSGKTIIFDEAELWQLYENLPRPYASATSTAPSQRPDPSDAQVHAALERLRIKRAIEEARRAVRSSPRTGPRKWPRDKPPGNERK